ncbi:MAG: SDR family NAD(P)-dependent oxidoreductase [Pseudomonadota bacterium]
MSAGFAIVTGASTGIGRELARIAADNGYDLLLAADTPFGADVPPRADTMIVDLSTQAGVDEMLARANGRPVDLLCANAGISLGHSFVEQSAQGWQQVVATNVFGTTCLLHSVLREMTRRGHGKVLVTGSIAGLVPGSYMAVYNATKAYLNLLCAGLRGELVNHPGITLTTLLPGATETEIFHRAGLDETKVGHSDKADPAKVARDGWDALMAGKADVVSGLLNKIAAAGSHIMPEKVAAALHTIEAKPRN